MTFRVQSTYSFDTLAPAILGSQFLNATMVGELSYELAMGRENVALKYRQIFPALPPGTTDSPTKARYFVFKTESGELTVLCDQWINLATVTEIKAVNFTVYFVQGQPEDIIVVRQLLSAAGFNNFTIK